MSCDVCRASYWPVMCVEKMAGRKREQVFFKSLCFNALIDHQLRIVGLTCVVNLCGYTNSG